MLTVVPIQHYLFSFRVQQAQLLRRRMAVMNTRTVMSTNNVPGVQMAAGVQSVPTGAVSPANSMGAPGLAAAAAGGLGGMQSPHQPGIGLKPSTQTPPANVLQVVKQVQEEAARQQAPHGGYGKVNPTGVPGQNMPPPQIRAIAHMGGPGQGKFKKIWFQKFFTFNFMSLLLNTNINARLTGKKFCSITVSQIDQSIDAL